MRNVRIEAGDQEHTGSHKLASLRGRKHGGHRSLKRIDIVSGESRGTGNVLQLVECHLYQTTHQVVLDLQSVGGVEKDCAVERQKIIVANAEIFERSGENALCREHRVVLDRAADALARHSNGPPTLDRGGAGHIRKLDSFGSFNVQIHQGAIANGAERRRLQRDQGAGGNRSHEKSIHDDVVRARNAEQNSGTSFAWFEDDPGRGTHAAQGDVALAGVDGNGVRDDVNPAPDANEVQRQSLIAFSLRQELIDFGLSPKKGSYALTNELVVITDQKARFLSGFGHLLEPLLLQSSRCCSI